MQTHLNTAAVNPATVLRALLTLDESAQDILAHVITRASKRMGWLQAELADAIRRQQEDEAAEAAWLEREAEKFENRFALEK